MSLSQQKYNTLVAGTKKHLRNLAQKRADGIVTADDATRYLSKNGVSERRVNDRLSITSAIFHAGEFKRAGMAYSSRPVARSRRINAWMAY